MTSRCFGIIGITRLFGRNDGGTTATEYAVLLALVITLAVGSITLVGSGLTQTTQSMSSDLDAGTNTHHFDADHETSH